MTVVRLIASKHWSASGRRVASRFLLTFGLCQMAYLYCRIDATAAQTRKSYFFATREACAASGHFREWECEAAFTIAWELLSDRAPTFSSMDECQFRFRLCGRKEPETESLYAPIALGIEIASTAEGSIAAPTLAIETPIGMLPPRPLPRAYEAQELDKIGRRDVELAPRADGFEPFRGRGVIELRKFIPNGDLVSLASEKARNASTLESLQARRTRIRSAPLIE